MGTPVVNPGNRLGEITPFVFSWMIFDRRFHFVLRMEGVR